MRPVISVLELFPQPSFSGTQVMVHSNRKVALMNMLRIGSVLLLGLCMAGMSGLASAQAARGGSGGAGIPKGPGGAGRPGAPLPVGHGGYNRPGGYHGSGGYYAHGGHGNWGVGVVIDPFWFVPGYYGSSYYYPRAYYSPYYYPPYYYPPAVVNYPVEPPEYIERGGDVEPVPQASASWYYCADPQGYYPYVKQCPGGWQAVPPQPPPSPDEGR